MALTLKGSNQYIIGAGLMRLVGLKISAKAPEMTSALNLKISVLAALAVQLNVKNAEFLRISLKK